MLALVPTSIPALCVDISIKTLDGNYIRVIGTPYRTADATPFEIIGQLIGRKTTRARQQHAVNAVIQELEARYEDVFGIQPLDKAAFLDAFDGLSKAVQESGLRLRTSWRSRETNTSALTYTNNQVFPLIYPYLNSKTRLFLESDRQKIEDTLVQGYMDRNGVALTHARSEIRKRLDQADCVLANMREFDHRIPLLHLCPTTPYERSPSPEQAKDLPRKILTLFYRRLSELIATVPKFVFFAILVVFGLRPAEAAARKPCDIVWHDTYCTLEVSSQERGGKLDKKLKNEFSRRVIIISFWGMTLLRMCCDRIGKDYPQDDTAMIIALDCSLKVKELLIECGASVETLVQLGEEIDSDDLDDDTPKGEDPNKMRQIKIVCYILRRIFASVLRNEMGMSMYVTDRLLGHAPKKTDPYTNSKFRYPDLNDPDTQHAIAQAMERYVFDERFSLNPACHPYKLSEISAISAIEFSVYVIDNDTDETQNLLLNIESAEPGERIEIYMETGSTHQLLPISTPKSWEDARRTVIGDTTPKED